ncbi:MAG TPA: DUF6703 family protein [Mycobacteriales bacterium]
MPYTTPDASPLRARVEERSAVFATYLAGRRVLVFVLLIGAVVGFFVLRGALSLLLGVPLLALIGWLSYLSWPHIGLGARVTRGAMLLVIAVVLVLHVAV